jgi:hypothetical protein
MRDDQPERQGRHASRDRVHRTPGANRVVLVVRDRKLETHRVSVLREGPAMTASDNRPPQVIRWAYTSGGNRVRIEVTSVEDGGRYAWGYRVNTRARRRAQTSYPRRYRLEVPA